MTGTFIKLIQSAGQGVYPCLFHIITGAYCPGCGGTRAFISLMKGKILLSLLYHPLVPYMALTVPCMVLYWGYCLKKKKTLPEKLWKAVLYTGILIVAGNFIIKNYLLLFQHMNVLVMLDQAGGI